nr:FXYD domain-containing ion transport regulator 3 isoform X3 [Desmodus rotundus]
MPAFLLWGQFSIMQQVALSLFILLAGLPALEANDPEDKNSPFYYATNQGTPHLLSLQALPTTVEDRSTKEHREPLSFPTS